MGLGGSGTFELAESSSEGVRIHRASSGTCEESEAEERRRQSRAPPRIYGRGVREDHDDDSRCASNFPTSSVSASGTSAQRCIKSV